MVENFVRNSPCSLIEFEGFDAADRMRGIDDEKTAKTGGRKWQIESVGERSEGTNDDRREQTGLGSEGCKGSDEGGDRSSMGGSGFH